jgi:hypothetical protein
MGVIDPVSSAISELPVVGPGMGRARARERGLRQEPRYDAVIDLPCARRAIKYRALNITRSDWSVSLGVWVARAGKKQDRFRNPLTRSAMYEPGDSRGRERGPKGEERVFVMRERCTGGVGDYLINPIPIQRVPFVTHTIIASSSFDLSTS